MKRTITLFLVLFTCLFAQAQELHIAKENILCLYGLKNATGAWLMEPRYTGLTKLGNSCYKTFDGVKYGLLDATGKEVIEPKYDELNLLNNGYYEVKNNSKVGFLSNSFQEIIPVEYAFASYLSGSNEILLHKKINDTVYSTIVRMDLKTSLPLTKGAFFPSNRNWVDHDSEKNTRIFTVGDSCRFVAFSGRTVTFGKLGLSDETGRVLVPKMYDEIEFRDKQSCWVIKDRKLGAVKLGAGVIFEPEYYYDYSDNYEHRLQISGNTAALIPILGPTNHYGRMDVNGKIVIAPEYDEIKKGNYPLSNSFLKLVKNGKVGLAGEKGEIICEAIYDTLIPMAYVNPTTDVRTQSIEQVWLVFRKEGCYGVMNTRGEVVVPADYKTFTRHWYKNRQVGIFTKDQLVVQLEFGRTEVKVLPMKLINKESSIYLYTADSIPVPFLLPKNQQNLQLHERFSYEDNFLRVYQESGNMGAILFNNKGKSVFPNYVVNNQHLGGNYYEISTANYHNGVYDISTRKLLIDTAYSRIEMDAYGNFWAQPYRSSNGEKKLFDRSGKLLIRETFATPFRVGDTATVVSNGKMGILSPDLKWIIHPLYQYIHPFGKSAFIVKSLKNKYGVLTNKEMFLADTVYTEIFPVYSYGFSSNRNYDLQSYSREEWWVLVKDSDSILMNDKGEKINLKTQAVNYKEKLNELAIKWPQNEIYGGFRLAMKGEDYLRISRLDSLFRSTGYRDYVLEYYRSKFWKTRPCFSWNTHFNTSPECTQNPRLNTLMGAGKRFYSVETKWYESRYSMEMPLDPELFAVYDNVLYSNGKHRSLELKEIFGSETILRRELENAVRLAENLHSSCGDPDKLLDKIKGFYLTSEGVNIFYEYLESEPLIIPVSRLNAVPESKWIVPYLQ